ncbi:hypothetical protein KY332_01150 [Candidatus Woesearchaeota archaeon]|nr:hypothetical protein [Candidatus Woesearchaeota archaeon]
MKNIIKLLLCGALGVGGAQALKADDGLFLEETISHQDENSTFYHFLGLSNDKGSYAKILFTDNEDPDSDSISYSGRGGFDLFGIKGLADLIGFNSGDDFGYGVNARGDVNDFVKLGLALEKKVESGLETKMNMAYTSLNLDNFKLNFGLSNTDVEGDETGRGTATLAYTQGQNMYGFGITSDGFDKEAEGFATAMVGRFGKKAGDFGYRAWVKSDFEGNYTIDLLLSTNTTISAGTINAITSMDDGLQDQKLFSNRFDTATYLWERAKQGGIIGHASQSEFEDTLTRTIEGLYKFHKKGAIAPMAGLGFSSVDNGIDTTDSIYGMVGAELDKGYIELKITGTEGQKPSFNLVAGYGF